jgi:hypothetical protein
MARGVLAIDEENRMLTTKTERILYVSAPADLAIALTLTFIVLVGGWLERAPAQPPRTRIQITQPHSLTDREAGSDIAVGALSEAPVTESLDSPDVSPVEGTRSISSLDVLVVIYTSGMSVE